MKKFLFALLIALCCQVAWSQSADAVIANHKSDGDAQYVQMSKAMIQGALAFMPSVTDEMAQTKKVMENVDVINTIIYKNLDETAEAGIKQELAQLQNHGYQSSGEASQDGVTGISLIKVQEGVVTDLIVFGKTSELATLMQMKGRIPLDQVGAAESFGK